MTTATTDSTPIPGCTLSPPRPAARLRAAFNRTRTDGRCALIGCLPAGFPTVEQSVEALRVLSRHVDVLEVGLPHRNPDLEFHPGAWGETSASGLTVIDVLDVVRRVAATVSVPVMLMSSWDPIRSIGARYVAATLASAEGAAGLVVPGVHPKGHAAARWLTAAGRHQLATAFTASPGVRRDAAEASTGWISLSARTSREGRLDQPRTAFASPAAEPANGDLLDLASLRGRARILGQMTTTPVCASGGVFSPAMAEAIAPAVDGVVIRSAFVRTLLYARTFEEGLASLDERAAGYAAAVRRGGRTTHAGPAPAHDRCRASPAA
ncbi:tryptophan synthase subunit alpha [Streptomyces niveus]|uniref:tryptophan synthase subunit alpha n=1 Tax=Streptomyces niveus TaxID=193462 RepID=UPI0036C39E13